MSDTITPVKDDVYRAVKAWLVDVTGLDAARVVQGLGNRVPLPVPGPTAFIVMTVVLLARLRTNVETWDLADPSPATTQIEEGTQMTLQLDVFGPGSADLAAMLCTLLRSDSACVALAPTCAPLYSDDPRMAPLTDEESQYEERWIVGAQLQYNPVVVQSQDFADTLTLDLVNVDEAYPP